MVKCYNNFIKCAVSYLEGNLHVDKIFRHPQKKITLEEIRILYNINADEYTELVTLVYNLLEENKIQIVKASNLNGRRPALYNAYKINFPKENYEEQIEELSFKIVPRLDISYYLNHINQYNADRKLVLQLNDFMLKQQSLLSTTVSLNERSFQIWNYEKELSEGSGRRILKNLGLSVEDLNIYETTEPLAYYSITMNSPQNIIIAENKDTFYSIRRYLLSGKDTIFGVKIGTIVYGAGKRIDKNFMDFFVCAPEYLSDAQNHILYFGDLDYEGILIYEGFVQRFKEKCSISLFRKAYVKMLDKFNKNNTVMNLPNTKKGQNTSIGEVFMNEFKEKEQKMIQSILESGRYIPQEILNVTDFSE